MSEKFNRLVRHIKIDERRAHPTYSSSRIDYIARAAAGRVARNRKR